MTSPLLRPEPPCDHVWIKTIEDDMVTSIRCDRCWKTPLDLLSERVVVTGLDDPANVPDDPPIEYPG